MSAAAALTGSCGLLCGTLTGAEDAALALRAEQGVELVPAEPGFAIRNEHVNRFSIGVLKPEANRIRLVGLPRWNDPRIETDCGRSDLPTLGLLLQSSHEQVDDLLRPWVLVTRVARNMGDLAIGFHRPRKRKELTLLGQQLLREGQQGVEQLIEILVSHEEATAVAA